MTRHRKLVLFAACGLVALIAVYFFFLREKEPSYNGRSLSEWLDLYDGNNLKTNGVLEDKAEAAEKFVRITGTNMIGTLLDWHATRTPVIDGLAKVYRKVPQLWHRPGSGYDWVVRHSAAAKHHNAAVGFEILGTNAESAAPELIRQFNRSHSMDEAQFTAESLGAIGPIGITALANAVTNSEIEQQEYALEVLQEISHRDHDAVPHTTALFKAVEDTNSHCSWMAITILYGRTPPEEMVPRMTRAMQMGDDNHRSFVIELLKNYGRRASNAVPELLVTATNGSPRLQECAKQALESISPESLTNSHAN